jgi:tetratricopeptide (TPR) repeat protein
VQVFSRKKLETMSVFGSSGIPGGFHTDVLCASPTDDQGKANLVEELKRRAKGAIGSKSYEEAAQLYTKAIEVAPDNAILSANRSMVNFSMKKYKEALDDATTATELDSQYAKAFYRKAVAHIALDQYREAHSTLDKGLKLAPSDKDLKAQMNKVEKEMDRLNREGKLAPEPKKTTIATETKTYNATTSADKVQKEDKVVVENDEDLGGDMRGYKTTSDGRKTTFFNNEMDEKTKNLIGDIAPKPLAQSNVSSSPSPCPSGVSAWNSAGTFESRDQSAWAKERIQALLSQVSCSEQGATLTVSNVKSVTGDAQIISSRGKTKRVYDYSAELEWSMKSVEDSDTSASGKMSVVDITGDKDYEIPSIEVDKKSSDGLAHLVKALVRTSGKGLQKAIVDALDVFYNEMQLRT